METRLQRWQARLKEWADAIEATTRHVDDLTWRVEYHNDVGEPDPLQLADQETLAAIRNAVESGNNPPQTFGIFLIARGLIDLFP